MKLGTKKRTTLRLEGQKIIIIVPTYCGNLCNECSRQIVKYKTIFMFRIPNDLKFKQKLDEIGLSKSILKTTMKKIQDSRLRCSAAHELIQILAKLVDLFRSCFTNLAALKMELCNLANLKPLLTKIVSIKITLALFFNQSD